MLLLQYDQELVPAGGSAVFSNFCGLGKTYKKDAAGHIFHYKALRQAGLVVGKYVLW